MLCTIMVLSTNRGFFLCCNSKRYLIYALTALALSNVYSAAQIQRQALVHVHEVLHERSEADSVAAEVDDAADDVDAVHSPVHDQPMDDVIASPPSAPRIGPFPNQECDICSQLSLTRDQLDYVHKEMAKKMILDKLRMTRPPNITQPLPVIPKSILRQTESPQRRLDSRSSHPYYAETERIIILASSGNRV